STPFHPKLCVQQGKKRLAARRVSAALVVPRQASATPRMGVYRLARRERALCANTALHDLTRGRPLPATCALSWRMGYALNTQFRVKRGTRRSFAMRGASGWHCERRASQSCFLYGGRALLLIMAMLALAGCIQTSGKIQQHHYALGELVAPPADTHPDDQQTSISNGKVLGITQI